MEIKFNVFWKKNLGTLYKDNSVDILGKEVSIDLDLSQVNSIYANFKVGGKSFTDLVEIVDVEANLIKIPFKTDVIKAGINELELVASMKNGSVMPSQTYAYSVEKSLEDPESIEAETNYPILVKLLQDVDIKVKEVNESSARVNDLVSRVEASVDELESSII